MTTYRYLTAAEWGMTWKRPAVPEKLLDPEAFVHHTAGSRLGEDAVQAFRALNRWAQDGKNYSALDYDILVHYSYRDDLLTIGGGREEWMSAATRDRNEQGEAICVMGYFHPGHVLSQHPHPAEVEGVARAIVWGIERGWIARDARVLGHHENPAHPGATGCPGAWFIPHLPTVRARVGELLNPPEDDMEYVTFSAPGQSTYAPGVKAVYLIHAGTIRWISPDVHAASGAPMPTRAIGAAEARKLTLIGPSPDGARHFARQVA